MQELDLNQLKEQIKEAEKTIETTKENIFNVKKNLEILKQDEKNLPLYEAAKKQVEEAEANFLQQVAKIEELKNYIQNLEQ
ncbi:MAG TPA: hypothetical protein PLI27_09210 [Ignavibacteriales bacterium]|nr:hypothetical protein [Ignavibacteriales bacterium]HOL80470.1 hypothetical protein [Ignavibacteriales bacterium]HOM64921.1 hypothetical protein [Ignavibacteriales bacterium]HPD68238.1 hypothetical protein [Ignavibacteriales bacterium]HPP32660.1 hypothetical protein [Ignavibacteriales bacterium]